jgi:hypothetical protein
MGAACRVSFFLMLISFSSAANAFDIRHQKTDTSSFVLVREADGILLYERWYSLTADLRAREIKATFKIRATPSAAVALIRDASKGKQWNANTCSYKVLDLTQSSWTSYIQYDLPWPISNQDCVLQYQEFVTRDTISIFFKGIRHASFPQDNRIHRIHELRGKWVFVKTDNEYHVEYFITTTPNKTLPGWVTDPIIRNNLVQTLVSFRSLVEELD